MNVFTPSPGVDPQEAQEDFGRRIAARLSDGATGLPHDIGERLRAARMQAVARRKTVHVHTAQAVQRQGTAAVLAGGWRLRLASVLPLVILAAGLVFIHITQNEQHANETAEVDAALLSSELPTTAYTDPGFAQFLKGNDIGVR